MPSLHHWLIEIEAEDILNIQFVMYDKMFGYSIKNSKKKNKTKANKKQLISSLEQFLVHVTGKDKQK